VLARVVERQRAPNGAERVVLQGVSRVTLTGFPSVHPHLEASWVPVAEAWPSTPEALGMREAFRNEIEESTEVLGAAAVQVALTLPAPVMVDAVASTLEADQEWYRDVLSTHDPVARA
jgi:Lon protease-like protein